MFFRREKPREISFAERLENCRKAGFAVQAETSARVQVARDGCRAVVEDAPGTLPRVSTSGVVVGGEIGSLVDVGYQKMVQTPGGRRASATASQLKALHAFQEDLREALGLTSLYNESLGTVNDSHAYDRVEGRDRGVPRRPWER